MEKKIIGDPTIKRDPQYPIRMRWEAILSRLPKDKALTGVEIGVLIGDTASRILAHSDKIVHIMVDPWVIQGPDSSWVKAGDNTSKKPQGFHDTAFELTKKRTAFAGQRAIIWRVFSKEASERICDRFLDYCFIDGDHSYDGCKDDIALWLPKVKPGGWIGGHDYGNPRLTGVKKAVDEVFPSAILELDSEDTWFARIK